LNTTTIRPSSRRPQYRCKNNYLTITANDGIYTDVDTTIKRSLSMSPMWRTKYTNNTTNVTTATIQM